MQKCVISGGGSLANYLDDFYEAIGLEISNGWGLTETSPVIAARRIPLPGQNTNARGRAVQVEAMKLMFKVPGTKRLKLECGKLLSFLRLFCFQCQLAPLHRGEWNVRGTIGPPIPGTEVRCVDQETGEAGPARSCSPRHSTQRKRKRDRDRQRETEIYRETERHK